jgi:hypothetical protein
LLHSAQGYRNRIVKLIMASRPVGPVDVMGPLIG